MFKKDVSFNVKYDEVDGVKINPRLNLTSFTLGGVEFGLAVEERPSNRELPFDLMIESPCFRSPNWTIETSVLDRSKEISVRGSFDRLCNYRSIICFSSSVDRFDLNVDMRFKNISSDDIKEAEQNRYNGKIDLDSLKQDLPTPPTYEEVSFTDQEAAAKSNFKFILGGDKTRPIYVKKGLVEMHSSYFQTLFTKKVNGKYIEKAKLNDVTEEEFIEYLRCVCPPVKPLALANIDTLLRLTTRYKNNVLMGQIEAFLSEKKMKNSEEKCQALMWANRYEMPILFYNIVDKLEKADFECLDSEAVAQFEKNYKDVLNERKRVVGAATEESGDVAGPSSD